MPKITTKTKPLKPYRRGETLGKASRSGKPSKSSNQYVKPIQQPIIKEVVRQVEDEDEEEEFDADDQEFGDELEEEEEEDEDEDEEDEGEIEFDDDEVLDRKNSEEVDEEEEDEEEEEKEEEVVLPLKRKSGKKGKKFIESQSALLSLIASITGDQAQLKKLKLSKVKAAPKETEKELKLIKEALKKKQLDAAKAIVSAQTRAKKMRRNDRELAKKERTNSTTVVIGNNNSNQKNEGVVDNSNRKKRVSFA